MAGAVLALCAACSSGGSTSPSPTASSAAAAALTDLASRGAGATYTGFYAFHQVRPNSTAKVVVWHSPPNLRVDVISGGATATFIRTAKATISCAKKQRKVSCFTVAGAGKPAPAPFDVGPATLFSDDLLALSASGISYVVTQAPSVPAGGGVPSATCFGVKAGGLTPVPIVQPGTYCFADAGLLTSVTYPNGNTARLVSVRSAAPAVNFRPYVHPSPLPS
jgi:hypothetical protein